MPVDGKLTSRREVTGRALGTAGATFGVHMEADSLFENATSGKSGKMGRGLFRKRRFGS